VFAGEIVYPRAYINLLRGLLIILSIYLILLARTKVIIKKMRKFLKPLTSWWRLNKKVKNARLAYQLLPETFTPAISDKTTRIGETLIFDRYATKFSDKQLSLFGNDGALLLKYIKSPTITFGQRVSGREVVDISLDGHLVKLLIDNRDNLKVVEEIFMDRLYDLEMPGEYIVFDVGMNVASASLYFASMENVKKVYGFEPFPGTFKLAEENLALNTSLASKIEIFNYGLGRQDEWLNVPVPAAGALGGSTTASFLEYADSVPVGAERMRVEIKDIAINIETLRSKHPGIKIILKLDCEGAEYEIMDRLQEAQLVSIVDIYMVEYHFRGKKPLQNVLSANGYVIIAPGDDLLNEYGMLYAVNPKAQP
jgi:FkbM family methyltransferase